MSHVAVVRCQVKDLGALKTAAEKLGGEFMEGQTRFRMWGSERQPCLHAIRVKGKPNAYEVGLRYTDASKPEEGFDFACDFYDGTLTGQFGSQLVNLRNEYTAAVAEAAMRKRGFRVRRDAEAPANVIRLVAQQ